MKHQAGKFKFSVPDDAKTPDGQLHQDAGKELEKPFEYDSPETVDEANEILAKRKLNIVGLVSEKVKNLARSAAYQAATLVYKPSEVSAEDIQERAIRDLIRLGMSEEAARNMVVSATAAKTE
jgi:hypothetical protein